MNERTTEGSEPHLPHGAHPFSNLIEAAHSGKVRLVTLREGEYPKSAQLQDLPGIDNIILLEALNNQNWGLPDHRNKGIELSFLETGHAKHVVGGKTYEINPGDVFLTLPWQTHRVGNPSLAAARICSFILDIGASNPDEEWTWPQWLVLSDTDRDALRDLLRNSERSAWHANAEIGRCFDNIAKLITKPDRTSTAYSRLIIYLNEVLVCLLDLLREHEEPESYRLEDIQGRIRMLLDSLEQRLDEPWTIQAMADITGFGRTRLTYYCRRMTCRTPMQYLTYRRIEASKRLLINATRSITEIAFACGFQTSQYFSTVFRREVGVAPSEFREAAVPKTDVPKTDDPKTAVPDGAGERSELLTSTT